MKEQVLVEISARHVHLSEADLAVLFGADHKLTFKKELSQPGQFASEERVSVVGPRNTLNNVIILGPTRLETQVELSLTDTRTVGITPVIRESGDIENTPGCTLVGPKGELTIEKGVIVAKRHIHLTVKDAEYYEVEDKQVVSVKIKTDERSLIFDDVVIRVRDDFARAMHIDTDEGNAAGISGSAYGEIIV